MKILIATQNQHKVQEIRQILSNIPLSTPEQKLEIPENKTSYIENALIKAKAWATLYPDHYILADDSGIEIEALDNAPGVISSEWCGINSSQKDLLQKTLHELKDTPLTRRQARFVSYIVLLSPQGNIVISRGECMGQIAMECSGAAGFGYDPLFIPLGFDVSMAELSPEQKNKISHRNKALQGIKDYFDYLGTSNER